MDGRAEQLGRITGTVAGERVADPVGEHDGIEGQDGRVAQPEQPELPFHRLRAGEGERVRPVGVRGVPRAVDGVGHEAERGQREREPAEQRGRLPPAEVEAADAVDEHGDARAERECDAEGGEGEPGLGGQHRSAGREAGREPHRPPAHEGERPAARGPRQARAGGDQERQRGGPQQTPHREAAALRPGMEAEDVGQVQAGAERQADRRRVGARPQVGQRPGQQQDHGEQRRRQGDAEGAHGPGSPARERGHEHERGDAEHEQPEECGIERGAERGENGEPQDPPGTLGRRLAARRAAGRAARRRPPAARGGRARSRSEAPG